MIDTSIQFRLEATTSRAIGWVQLATEEIATPAEFGGPAEVRAEIADLIRAIGTQMRMHFVASVKKVGLAPPQAMALLQLDKPLSMGRLAEELALDASYITGIADQLEERKLIERRPDPADRRRKILALTVEGRRIHDELSAQLDVSQSPVIAALTTGEQRQLRDLLAKVMRSVEAG